MKFDTIEVSGWKAAIKGMRNPLESWSKSDTYYNVNGNNILIGENDLGLMQKLIKGGSEHRKFLRYISVQFDMTAPLYIWKEFDTYKVGTVANSTSTMHKLASTPITLDCFEIDDYENVMWRGNGNSQSVIEGKQNDIDNVPKDIIIPYLENLRLIYLETKDKIYWKELIRWLPESWLQTRTIDLNYEVLRTIVHQRQNHKLSEWHQFIDWVHTLPYSSELIFYEN